MVKKNSITIISSLLLYWVLLYINSGYNYCRNYSKCISWGDQTEDNIHEHPGPCYYDYRTNTNPLAPPTPPSTLNIHFPTYFENQKGLVIFQSLGQLYYFSTLR